MAVQQLLPFGEKEETQPRLLEELAHEHSEIAPQSVALALLALVQDRLERGVGAVVIDRVELLELGLQLLERTLAGYATHANFWGVLVVGLGCEANQINAWLAHSSLRMTIGRFTTEEEIDYVIVTLKDRVAKLRDLSPLWDMYLAAKDQQWSDRQVRRRASWP